ncbi:MAG: NAD-dependent epimerase/dehydratase family protein [Candidatus Omnitrophica bacterium]|nr:NAD-dependent epimerase/dehydratase family protein [Candidatus Omnitrophota bacterium]
MRILITGATGFIGKALCEALYECDFDLRAAVRQKDDKLSVNYEIVEIGDIGPQTNWQKALVGVDIVVHSAGRAHILGNKADNSLAAFRRVNALGTERLARMAAKWGVKKFIFISSVKVNGEGAPRSYTENDLPAPKDAYGISKQEAEGLLARIAAETGLQCIVLRLPLVYGPGVKANFKNLIKMAGLGLPLPFGGITNRRSFIYLGNLIDAIITCVTHPLAAGETFMVSDGEDISTPKLIKMIAFAMDKKALLFSLHPGILRMLGKIAGKGEEVEKLTRTLLIDSSKIRNLLGWKPPFTIEEGIKKTVKG